MNCSSPLDAAVLADYWIAALAGPEEEAVEEHLLGCDACGARLREVIVLAEGVRGLARERSSGGPRRADCASALTPLPGGAASSAP
jgi:hypothetical protein